jgi:hypothetical protein
MSPDRILYVGAIKFIFQGMLAFSREPVTAPMRRAMWAIAKDRANDYCHQARIHHAPAQPSRPHTNPAP